MGDRMLRMVGACAALVVAGNAWAANPFTLADGWLIEPVEDTFYENGAGAPTVAYDAEAGQYVMFFEVWFSNDGTWYDPTSSEYVGCGTGAQAVWGIGRATSPDGLDWTVDPDPVVVPPGGDSYYACVAAHPKVIFDGTTWHLWFRAWQQKEGICDDTAAPEPSWGCARQTGIGYASSTNGVDFTIGDEPILNIRQDHGYQAVVQHDGTWNMLITIKPDVYLATSSSPDEGWTLREDPVFEPGSASWIEGQVYNTALTCNDGTAGFTFTSHFGGRTYDTSGAIATGGWGKATSPDALEWYVSSDSPYFEWEGDLSWRHWDTLRVGTHYILYFAESVTGTDGTKRNHIGLGYTTDTWDPLDIGDRICFTEPPDTGDTDTDTGDTDTDTGDTDTDTGDTDTDTDDLDTDTGVEPRTGCCRKDTSSGEAAAFGLLLLPLLMRRRRRS